MLVGNPVTGYLPIKQALVNVGEDRSLENIDAVDALLQANPAFLSQVIKHKSLMNKHSYM
jgi:hypothetical protein